MSMSKKDFVDLADRLKRVKNGNDGGLVSWEYILEEICQFCKSQNFNFNRERFLDYLAGECGPSGGKVKKQVKTA